MSLLLSIEQHVAMVAARVCFPFNPKCVKDNQDVCITAINGSVLHYYHMIEDASKPINIVLFCSYASDHLVSDALDTAECVHDVITCIQL